MGPSLLFRRVGGNEKKSFMTCSTVRRLYRHQRRRRRRRRRRDEDRDGLFRNFSPLKTKKVFLKLHFWRYDIQPNDIQPNDTRHNDMNSAQRHSA